LIKKDAYLSLFLFAAGASGFVLLMKSDLGLSRDWDLYAMYLFPSVVLAVLFVLKSSAAGNVLRNSLIIFSITWIHTSAWISINASREQSLKYFESLPNDFLWSKNAMAHAMDELESYYREKRDANRSLYYALKYLKYDPDNVRIVENIGIIYMYAFNDISNARIWFQKAAALNSTRWLVYSNLASISMKQQDYQDAIPLLEKSIALNPKSIEPRLDLAYILDQRLGRKREAYIAYKEILRIDPNNLAALQNAGIIGYQVKDFGPAKLFLQRYLMLSHDNSKDKKVQKLLDAFPK
jgi:tetratricopeptide (TPR) repeat protein